MPSVLCDCVHRPCNQARLRLHVSTCVQSCIAAVHVVETSRCGWCYATAQITLKRNRFSEIGLLHNDRSLLSLSVMYGRPINQKYDVPPLLSVKHIRVTPEE